MRDLFTLDPAIVFLNHGSFGAVPAQVMEAQRKWQARLERQPVLFLSRELTQYYEPARQALADYLHAPADRLAYMPNVTHGVNMIARTLELEPGDEILSTNHEYGACHNIWEFISGKTGSRFVRQPIRFPAQSPDSILEDLWQGVTSKTRCIFISHLSSPTALRFPVEEICKRAREAGILSIVDGAHAPGQLRVDLLEIDPDFYVGNCHKWMLGPKGSGFMYTRPDQQPSLEPLVVSWGWGEGHDFGTGSTYLDNLQWTGTIDPSAYLSVPAAIEFQAEHDWPAVIESCRRLLSTAIKKIEGITGLPAPVEAHGYRQMAFTPLPRLSDPAALKARLYDDYRVEVPVIEWEGRHGLRISIQAYNTADDVEALCRALSKLLPEYRRLDIHGC